MCGDEIRSIGHELKAVDHVMQRHFLKSASEAGIDKLTLMHGWIIGYLDQNRDRDVYQKDIESAFAISRSSVTSIVKNMEKKGYIRRISVDSDARLKKLELTVEGERFNDLIRQTIRDSDEFYDSLLTEEERETLIALVHKLRSGIESSDAKGVTVC